MIIKFNELQKIVRRF